MLTLFDIDGTILRTYGLGIRAMGEAGRRLHGDTFTESGVTFAGGLDPIIISDLFAANGVAHSDEGVTAFRGEYHLELERMLVDEPASLCPGVPELVDALDEIEEMTLGLLTGNFPETGELKLRSGGVDPARFRVRVWGEDSPHDPPSRDHLPPIGIERYLELHRREIAPQDVVIIGDTPADVRCARAAGCRCIAVATGKYSTEELLERGADLALDDLSQTQEIVEWITRAPVNRF